MTYTGITSRIVVFLAYTWTLQRKLNVRFCLPLFLGKMTQTLQRHWWNDKTFKSKETPRPI